MSNGDSAFARKVCLGGGSSSLSRSYPERASTMDSISSTVFNRFVTLQKSGVCNMMDEYVQRFLGISRDQHLTIINNYMALQKREEERDEDAE